MSNSIRFAVFLCFALLGTLGASDAAPASAPFTAHVLASGARDLGRANPHRPLEITVTFARRNAAELAALIAEQSDRTSPLRGHYLTPAQFDASFAPSIATVASVTQTLARNGFVAETSVTTGSTRRFLGTAKAADDFFGTEIHSVAQPGYGVRYATTRRMTMPASIARDVVAINGFDNLTDKPMFGLRPVMAAPEVKRAGQSAIVHAPILPKSDYRCEKAGPSTVDIDRGIPAQDATVGYSPGTFESDFRLPIERGCGGKGVAIGIFGDALPADSDITAYWSAFDISRQLPAYTLRQATPSVTDGDAGEALLDIDLISGLAPNASLYFYEDDGTASGSVATLNMAAADNIVSVMSVSFIYCEAYDNGATSIAENSAVEQLAAQGITVVAATGDTGYEMCFSTPGIGSPATSTYAVAVGGVGPAPGSTQAYRGARSGWSGSTGGTSTVIAKGAYQKGVAACSTAYRCIPDIAIASGVGTYPIASTATEGALVYSGGSPNAFSGTSMSAPIFSAMQAEADEYAGHRMGFINPLLYGDYYVLGSSARVDPFQIFQDVTTGNNGVSATTGWDFVTGLGVPDGEALARVEALI